MHEWISDNGQTPHIVVDATVDGVEVPAEHVKEGKIILNIGHGATSNLSIGNEIIEFGARFGGAPRQLTIPVSAPGYAGMETIFQNVLEPGDKAVICQNGVFGGRMKEVAERCGAEVVMVEDEWGKPVDPNKVEDALRRNPGTRLLAVAMLLALAVSLAAVRTRKIDLDRKRLEEAVAERTSGRLREQAAYTAGVAWLEAGRLRESEEMLAVAAREALAVSPGRVLDLLYKSVTNLVCGRCNT